MAFPLGKPLLVMLLIALVSGSVLALRATPARKELMYWIFAESHRKEFRPVLPAFEAQHHTSVQLDLIALRGLYVRLLSMFMTGADGDTLPDCVHIEINQVGKFFRPPLDGIGMRDLTPYLESHGAREISDLAAHGEAGWNARLAGDGRIYTHDGQRWMPNPARSRPDMWLDRLLPARLAPWTKQGRVFGVPQDVHPVTITYRDDLFRAAGIDLAACITWRRFHDACLAMQEHWRARGVAIRHGLELEEVSPDKCLVMLLQRHINVIDADGRVCLADAKVANTVAFYATMVAGARRIAGQASYDIANELSDGTLAACLTPDWRILYIRDHAPRTADGAIAMQGLLRMMPLPRFDPDDAPTSTWGGTCVSIPKACPRPDLAWQLIEHLYFSAAALDERLKAGNVLPALPETWNHPRLTLPDPLYGGQVINQLYVSLARELPRRYVTPSSGIAMAQLGAVIARAVTHVRAHGEDGLEAQCQAWLEAATRDVERRVARQRFDAPGTAGP
jgi:arabinosaccharide transport system substrate-binding protein